MNTVNCCPNKALVESNERTSRIRSISGLCWPVGLAACLVISGCASPRPMAYSGIASSSLLRPNAQDRSGRVPFSYATPVNWRQYYRVIIDPVVVYRGADSQFGKIPEDGRRFLAGYMQQQFTEKMKTVFEVVDKPAPGTLRLQLTLTGAKATTPVIGTLSRFDLAGGSYNAVQSVRGKEGTLTGSVIYAVEIRDASTDRLLKAFITKQYPSPMNIKASFGAMGAAMTGIRKGADELVEELTAPSNR
jgi:hypothetical protein